MEQSITRKNIAVTGASGFVGAALMDQLAQQNYPTRALIRRPVGNNADEWQVSSESSVQDIAAALTDIDVVVHLAARTHGDNTNTAGNLGQFQVVNIDFTRRLLEACVNSGVSHFVFLSSIKVNGEQTDSRPFTVDDPPAPEDAYGLSKLRAEELIREFCRERAMSYCIIRPPLIYGPQVKGNLAALAGLIKRGFPLPFAAIHNRRDLIDLATLVDFIHLCIEHPDAVNQTFLVADGKPRSTAQIIELIGKIIGEQPRLFGLPVWVLDLLGKLTGKQEAMRKLTGDLEVDIKPTCRQLDWHPGGGVRQNDGHTASG